MKAILKAGILIAPIVLAVCFFPKFVFAAEKSDWLHVDDHILRSISVKFPFCKIRNDRIITMRVDHHVPRFAVDEKYIGSAAWQGWNILGNWRGNDFCTPGQLSFTVKIQSFYNGVHVSDADVEYHYVNYRLRYKFSNYRKINSPSDGDDLSKLREEILAHHYGKLESESKDFKFDVVLDKLKTYVKSTSSAPKISEALYLMGYVEGFRMRLAGAFTLSRKTSEYYQSASDLGHPIATLKLLKASGLTDQLDRIFFNAQEGKELLTSDITAVITNNHSLFLKGVEQKVGRLVAFGPALATVGVEIASGKIQLAETATPYSAAIDHAMNHFLKDNLERGTALLGFSTGSCDGTWCYGLNKSVMMRLISIGKINCLPTVENKTTCSFLLRWVLSMDQSKLTGFPNGPEKNLVNGLVNNIVRGNVMQAKAGFRRDGSQWVATNQLEIVSEGKTHTWKLP